MINSLKVTLSSKLWTLCQSVIAPGGENDDVMLAPLTLLLLSAESSMDIRPNHTIYINNINDKIKKDGTCALIHPSIHSFSHSSSDSGVTDCLMWGWDTTITLTNSEITFKYGKYQRVVLVSSLNKHPAAAIYLYQWCVILFNLHIPQDYCFDMHSGICRWGRAHSLIGCHSNRHKLVGPCFYICLVTR